MLTYNKSFNNFIIKSIVESYYSQNDSTIQKLVEQYFRDVYFLDESDDGEMSTLDKELQGIDSSIGQYIRPNTPIIYAFTTNILKTAVKIGFTTQGAQKRLEQWKKHYPDAQLIGYWDAIEFQEVKDENGVSVKKKVFFQDHPVHQETTARGYDNITREEFNKVFDELAQEDFSFDLSTLKRHYSQEFFRNINKDNVQLNKDVIEQIINVIKQYIKEGNTKNIATYSIDSFEKTRGGGKPLPIQDFQTTNLQREAIDSGVDAIKRSKTHLLLAAVMRFGKTFTTYNIVKEAGCKMVVVCSAKADARDPWRDDIYHKNFMNENINFTFLEFDNIKHKGMILVSDKNQYMAEYPYTQDFISKLSTDPKRVIILFSTLQDISGKKEDEARVIKERHQEIFKLKWDITIVDETHFATRSEELGKALGYKDGKHVATDVTEQELDDTYENANYTDEEVQKLLVKPLNAKIQLHLSGTPYNVMRTTEFSTQDSEIIGRYSYTDMLMARDKWIEDNVVNGDKKEWESPYFGVPDLIRFGMNVTTKCRKEINKKLKNDGLSETFAELFKVPSIKEIRENDNVSLKFVHEAAIIELMEAIFGKANRKRDNKLVGFLNRPEIKRGEVMKHIVICLPKVLQCHALAELLKNRIFVKNNDKREVIVAVENDDSIIYHTQYSQGQGYMSPYAKNSSELNSYLTKQELQGKQTVTITVDRLMTAVSVPLWDAMLYLKDTENSQEYDQNIFRICTRNVKKIKNADGSIKDIINLKPNVYLIDFKISRMFSLMKTTAVSQNVIAGKSTAQDIENTIDNTLQKMPIFIESDFTGQLTEMKKLSAKDFMKFYMDYNANRSIDDTIEPRLFKNVLQNDIFDNIINKFDKDVINTKKKGKVNLYDTEGNAVSNININDTEKKKIDNTETTDVTIDNKKKNTTENNTDLRDKMKKLSTMLKSILYFAMCLDGADGLRSIMEKISKDKKVEQMAHDFGLDMDMLRLLDANMTFEEHTELDSEIYNLLMLHNDTSKTPLQRIKTMCKKLGKVGENEFITPEALCKKMLSIPDPEIFKKAKRILLINEKYGEFLIAIKEMFGDSVANKCVLIPSSAIGAAFCNKTIKDLGLKANIWLSDDYNNNGYYDIEDFILCPNEKLIEEANMGKKFDICIMNPPFNKGKDFFIKGLQTADVNVCVMPSTWLMGQQQNKVITSYFDKYGGIIEQLEGTKWFDAAINSTMSINYCNSINPMQYILLDNKKYKECKEIRKYTNDDLLMEFFNIVKPDQFKDNIHNHIKREPNTKAFKSRPVEKNPNPEWWVYRTIAFAGHGTKGSKESGEFYTIISNMNYDKACDKYKNLREKIDKFCYYIPFETEQTLKGFWNYIHTDFVRICLYFIKNSVNLGAGELTYIPWQNFSDPIFQKPSAEIDDYLFNKYNIRKEVRDHIEEVIPDYYGIRKQKGDKQ